MRPTRGSFHRFTSGTIHEGLNDAERIDLLRALEELGPPPGRPDPGCVAAAKKKAKAAQGAVSAAQAAVAAAC